MLCRVGTTPVYSDVAAKRRVRDAFVAFVRDCDQPRPLLLIVDAWLPLSPDDTTRGSFLCEDLLRAIPGLSPEQIFSPNVDAAVVQALRRLDMPHVANECCCEFLRRRTGTIRAMGGFAACMVDVWGGFARGARRPIEWMASEQMLDTTGPHGAGVMFCASDRYGRAVAGDVLQARDDVQHQLHREVLYANGYVALPFPYRHPVSYSRTMQVHACSVVPAPTRKRPREE